MTQEPQVAAFDFDGTLTRGGSVWQFLVATVGARRVLRAASALIFMLARAALFGGEHADDAKEALFRRTLKGLAVEDLSRRAADFGLAHFRRTGRADVRARLEWHRRQGHRIVIVSASPDIYVRPVGEELGVDAVVATLLEVGPDGLLTGSYHGRNCRGPQKIERLEQWTRTSVGEQKPFLWAYGNSAGDLRLLSAAEVGVDAGRLGRFGKLRRFRRLSDLEDASGSANS